MPLLFALLLYKEKKASTLRTHYVLLFLSGWLLAITAIYSIIFIPIAPLSVIALLALGAGLLGLSPFLSFVLSCKMIASLTLKCRSFTSVRGMVLTIAFGAICGLLAIGLTEGRRISAKAALEEVLSNDPELQTAGLKTLRWLSAEDMVRQWAVDPTSWGIGDAPHVDDSKKVYYRLTGKTIGGDEKSLYGDWERSRMYRRRLMDNEVGLQSVGTKVEGLSLASSAIDISVAEDLPVAYTEWTLEFENSSLNSVEARMQMLLPPDSVASRLTLWIDGEEREAAFGKRSQTINAYRDVAVVRRRDPALFTSQGKDRVFLQCFPIQPNSTMRVKVGITSAPIMRGDTAYITLPLLSETNYDMPTKNLHAIWIESRRELAVIDPAFTLEQKEDLNATRAQLPFGTLHEHSVAAATPFTPSAETLYWSELGGIQGSAVFRAEPATVQIETVCVVVDGSVTCKGLISRKELESLFHSLPPNAKVELLFAGQEIGRQRFKPAQASAAVEWLAEQEYIGGCDPIPALLAAWESCSQNGAGRILWLRGQSPFLLSDVTPLKQAFQRRPGSLTAENPVLIAVPLLPGPNRIEEEFESVKGLVRIPVVGNESETLRWIGTWISTGAPSKLVYPHGAELETLAEGRQRVKASPHLVRLAVNKAVQDIASSPARKAEKDELQDQAVTLRLVTPLTGAVVLENKQQYARHDLDPDDSPAAVPNIPEPQEWALIICGAIVLATMAFMKYRREHAKA